MRRLLQPVKSLMSDPAAIKLYEEWFNVTQAHKEDDSDSESEYGPRWLCLALPWLALALLSVLLGHD